MNRSLIWFMVGSLRQGTMHYVYILWSEKENKFYIGYTVDLERRLKEHGNGCCHTTARMDNPKLVFFEAFVCENDARRREQYFKTTKGKKALRLMLREGLREFCPVV